MAKCKCTRCGETSPAPLCETCFFEVLLIEYPELRIEGDKVIGIRLKTAEELKTKTETTRGVNVPGVQGTFTPRPDEHRRPQRENSGPRRRY